MKLDGTATRYSQLGKMFEPSYRQKLMVLKEIGVWKEIALEVMPPQRDVVDREDCYHLWEFQYPYSFIFDHRPIYEAPKEFGDEFNGIQYHVKTVGDVRYIYFKPENENEQIGWKKKQNLKNHVIGMDGTAVELILDGMADKHYACMVCLPRGRYLDFGLI